MIVYLHEDCSDDDDLAMLCVLGFREMMVDNLNRNVAVDLLIEMPLQI
jgi:hypothetical protein